MKWLRPLFIINLVFVVLWLPVLPMFLMIVGDGASMIAVLCAGLVYAAASAWLVFRRKKNRASAIIMGLMASALLVIVVTTSIASNRRVAADCRHFQTQCAKLDGQSGLFHCGSTESQEGFITIAHVEEKCLPTKEQSCAYAKQLCTRISTDDSVNSVYKCGSRDTIACP